MGLQGVWNVVPYQFKLPRGRPLCHERARFKSREGALYVTRGRPLPVFKYMVCTVYTMYSIVIIFIRSLSPSTGEVTVVVEWTEESSGDRKVPGSRPGGASETCINRDKVCLYSQVQEFQAGRRCIVEETTMAGDDTRRRYEQEEMTQREEEDEGEWWSRRSKKEGIIFFLIFFFFLSLLR